MLVCVSPPRTGKGPRWVGPSSVTTPMAQALEKGSGSSSLGTAGLGSPQVPSPRQGAPAWTRSAGRRARGAGLSSCSPFPHPSCAPSRTSTWNLLPISTPVLTQERLPFEGILRLCPNRRLGGAAFSLGQKRKPNQTSIRGMAGDPQEFLPGSSSSSSISDSHGEGVPAFPRCYPGLLSQDSLQPVPNHGATQPPALEKLAGCYFKESWLEFLTNCYSLPIRCCPFQLCEQKKCD